MGTATDTLPSATGKSEEGLWELQMLPLSLKLMFLELWSSGFHLEVSDSSDGLRKGISEVRKSLIPLINPVEEVF